MLLETRASCRSLLAPVPRFLAAVALAVLPIFMANLVFTQRFKRTRRRRPPPSAPTCWAPCSAACWSTRPLMIGYRTLLPVVARLSGTAFLAGPKRAGRRIGPGCRRPPPPGLVDQPAGVRRPDGLSATPTRWCRAAWT